MTSTTIVSEMMIFPLFLLERWWWYISFAVTVAIFVNANAISKHQRTYCNYWHLGTQRYQRYNSCVIMKNIKKPPALILSLESFTAISVPINSLPSSKVRVFRLIPGVGWAISPVKDTNVLPEVVPEPFWDVQPAITGTEDIRIPVAIIKWQALCSGLPLRTNSEATDQPHVAVF